MWGGTSVLRPRLVCPLSAACYACCIPILREFRFPHLAVCLLWGNRLSVVRGLLRPLCLNSLGVLLTILSTIIMTSYYRINCYSITWLSIPNIPPPPLPPAPFSTFPSLPPVPPPVYSPDQGSATLTTALKPTPQYAAPMTDTGP